MLSNENKMDIIEVLFKFMFLTESEENYLLLTNCVGVW